jgi:hypothetical protein
MNILICFALKEEAAPVLRIAAAELSRIGKERPAG